MLFGNVNEDAIETFFNIGSHNMREAGEMCTRVAIIDEGCIVAIGPPEKLCSTINSRQYVEVRFGGISNRKKSFMIFPL